ncbi:MAG: acetyltransferase, partial [Bacteroidaceae bacterium]|nr:acetyltransferase [Bacteroidaceae bacterium]
MRKYQFIKRLLWLISLLPFPVLYAFADFASLFVRRYYRRQTVRDNLRSAFPEKTAQELAQIKRKFY